MVIVHLKMSGSIVPLQADDLSKAPLCPHMLRLENVVGITDDSVPGLKVESLTVRSELIMYYVRGVLEEVEEEEEPEVEEVEAEILEEIEEEEEEYIERRERRRGGPPKRKSRARKKESGYYHPVDEDIYD